MKIQKQSKLSRTQLAERQLEEFLGMSLIKEFVYRSPMAKDAGIDKEVADALVAFKSMGLLISQKAQEDPAARNEAKTEQWAKKQSQKAVKQLVGALKAGRSKPIWCMHPRRGRFEFPDGLPPIQHGIVIVEAMQKIDLEPLKEELPLQYDGVPITYLTLNDFLNLTNQLRTLPELIEYLNKRRVLSDKDIRHIGDEITVYNAYLLTDGTLAGIQSRADAGDLVEKEFSRLRQLIHTHEASLQYSKLMEMVADSLGAWAENQSKQFTSSSAIENL